MTDLAVVCLTGTVSICLPCFKFRQRGAPHEIHPRSLSLVLLERTAGYKAKIKGRPKVVICREGCHTHWHEVRASCNLNQNHGVAEERRERILFSSAVSKIQRLHILYLWRRLPVNHNSVSTSIYCNSKLNVHCSNTPVDICCLRHIGAASQQHLWGTIYTIYIPTVKAIADGLKVLLSVHRETIIWSQRQKQQHSTVEQAECCLCFLLCIKLPLV